MRTKIWGYGIWESIIAIIFLVLILFFDFEFLKGVIAGGELTEQIIFMTIFINLVGVLIVFLPLVVKKSEKISNKTIERFMELPGKDSRLTFPIISNFLSEQALASFLVTVLIFTGKQALQEYGGGIAAIYMFALFFVSVLLASMSLIRLLAFFTKYHWALYSFGATLSTGIMFAFFNVGLKLAT